MNMNKNRWSVNCTKVILCLLVSSFNGYTQSFIQKEARVFSEMYANSGNAVADYDQDGDLDIFMVARTSFNPATAHTASRLLENRGGWFEDVTAKAGFARQYSNNGTNDIKLGVAWGDYNGDGYPDLFLAHQNKSQLFKNKGDKTFIEVTEAANITSRDDSNNTGGLWWDYDNDGDLDLYMNYLGKPNRLYKNLSDGTFEEVKDALGLNDSGRTWSCQPIDANNDGWMDLYVINDFGLGNFYINQDGQSFVDATEEYNLRNTGDGMGSTVGDYNNDGYFDIYVTNIAESKINPLFTGSASGPFDNKTEVQGVGNGHFGWGTRLFDADNDGDQDLYIVNGMADLKYHNVFFKNLRNEGENRFEDWSIESATNGYANGMGVEVFDFDTDGDLDILVANIDDSPYFYVNGTANKNDWLLVNLEGAISNRDGLGAKLTAYSEGKSLHRFHFASGVMGQSIKPVHFGLGDIKKIDSLGIRWPSGAIDVIYDIAVNQKIKVVENLGMESGNSFEEKLVSEITEPNTENTVMTMVSHPNPFNESISFDLKNAITGNLSLEIYSVTGIRVFATEEQMASNEEWSTTWDGYTDRGIKLPSGMYFYNMRLGKKKWSGKILLNH